MIRASFRYTEPTWLMTMVLRTHLTTRPNVSSGIVHRKECGWWLANFPKWGPFANLFPKPKWGPFWTISAMVLFSTWAACKMHAKRKLQWRLRGHWTRGSSTRQCCWRIHVEACPASSAGDFMAVEKSQLWLAISDRLAVGEQENLQDVQDAVQLLFDFLGLGESCHLVWRLRPWKSPISMAICTLLRPWKSPISMAICTCWGLYIRA